MMWHFIKAISLKILKFLDAILLIFCVTLGLPLLLYHRYLSNDDEDFTKDF